MPSALLENRIIGLLPDAYLCDTLANHQVLKAHMSTFIMQASAVARGIFLWRGRCQPLIVFLFLGFCQLAPVSASGLRAYTEEWAPYNYVVGKEIKGISTDILRASCQMAKIECAIQLVPWSRAYKTVAETPNTLIYSIARTAQREKEFIWIGPILPRQMWIYGKPGLEASFHHLKDLAKTKIGIVRGDASQEELLAVGVPLSSILILNSHSDIMKMMKLDKINVVVNTEIGMEFDLKNSGMPSDAVVKLLKLSDGNSVYFGLNLQSDPTLIAQLQVGFDKLKREKKFDVIVRSYTKVAD